MKPRIITLLLLIGFSLHSYSQNSNFIEIKHTGSSDKPIWTILIAAQRIELHDDDFYKITIVDNSIFSQIKKFISEYNYRINEKVTHQNEYGSFVIIVGHSNKKIIADKTYTLLTIGKSRVFLKDFLGYCKTNRFNPDLTDQLQTTLNRITPN